MEPRVIEVFDLYGYFVSDILPAEEQIQQHYNRLKQQLYSLLDIHHYILNKRASNLILYKKTVDILNDMLNNYVAYNLNEIIQQFTKFLNILDELVVETNHYINEPHIFP